MNKNELAKIITVATQECKKNFARHKISGYTLAELTVIPFVSREVDARKVNDWGTDEDKDEYIWYSEEGWQHAIMVVQYGAGVNKVVKNHVTSITEQQVVDELMTWELFYQMQFISSAYSVLAISEFRSKLY